MAGMAGGLAAMMANAKTADADAESRQSGWSDDDSVFGKASSCGVGPITYKL